MVVVGVVDAMGVVEVVVSVGVIDEYYGRG